MNTNWCTPLCGAVARPKSPAVGGAVLRLRVFRAVDAGAHVVGQKGMLVNKTVIPSDPELIDRRHLNGATDRGLYASEPQKCAIWGRFVSVVYSWRDRSVAGKEVERSPCHLNIEGWLHA
jgi:hypothetical protein